MGGDVPDAQARRLVVGVARGEEPPVGREGDRLGPGAQAGQARDLGQRARIPQADAPVVARDREPAAVRAERHGERGSRARPQDVAPPQRRGVDEVYGAVALGDRERLVVRADRHAPRREAVEVVDVERPAERDGAEQTAPAEVPQRDAPIDPCADRRPPVRRDGDRLG